MGQKAKNTSLQNVTASFSEYIKKNYETLPRRGFFPPIPTVEEVITYFEAQGQVVEMTLTDCFHGFREYYVHDGNFLRLEFAYIDGSWILQATLLTVHNEQEDYQWEVRLDDSLTFEQREVVQKWWIGLEH